ncbi:MAG TPA: YesL family protein [Aggregatilineaceae bacterium]|nr:YesL family protein [Aggregatilineaceae bacterium]
MSDKLQDELWIVYYRAADLIPLNLLWFVASLPLITAIPALGALFYATNHMAHRGSSSWRVFMEGFRRCFGLSWRWGLMTTVILGILFFLLWFYRDMDWAYPIRLLITAILVAWIDIQLFTFPLLLEQSDQRFRTALRNSGVIFIRWPGIALGTSLLIALVALPSIFLFPPAWIFLSASLCTYLSNRAVLRAISKLKAAG